MTRAILIWQTRWEDVTRALAELSARNLSCSVAALSPADARDIEKSVWCTGFCGIKANRLQRLGVHVMDTFGSIGAMKRIPTGVLQAGLLPVKGSARGLWSVSCVTGFPARVLSWKRIRKRSCGVPVSLNCDQRQRPCSTMSCPLKTGFIEQSIHTSWNMQKVLREEEV